MKNMLVLIYLVLLCPPFTRTTLLQRGPIGVSLCKWICRTTFGCTSYTYLPLSLSCHRGKFHRAPEDQALTGEVQDTQLLGSISNTTCMRWSRVIFSRWGKPVCFHIRDLQVPNKISDKAIELKYHTKGLSFAKAKMRCGEEGGSLAQFSKGFPENTLKRIFMGKKYDCDLTYHKELKQFKWGDGTPYVDEDRWNDKEPTHTLLGWVEENCVCMKKTLLLQDITCKSRSDFICQVSM